MTHTLRTAILALALALAIGITSAHAATGGRWDRYRSRKSGNVLVVKASCLTAEDSAAHLRLIAFDAGRAVYGCSRKGY